VKKRRQFNQLPHVLRVVSSRWPSLLRGGSSRETEEIAGSCIRVVLDKPPSCRRQRAGDV